MIHFAKWLLSGARRVSVGSLANLKTLVSRTPCHQPSEWCPLFVQRNGCISITWGHKTNIILSSLEFFTLPVEWTAMPVPCSFLFNPMYPGGQHLSRMPHPREHVKSKWRFCVASLIKCQDIIHRKLTAKILRMTEDVEQIEGQARMYQHETGNTCA